MCKSTDDQSGHILFIFVSKHLSTSPQLSLSLFHTLSISLLPFPHPPPLSLFLLPSLLPSLPLPLPSLPLSLTPSLPSPSHSTLSLHQSLPSSLSTPSLHPSLPLSPSLPPSLSVFTRARVCVCLSEIVNVHVCVRGYMRTCV